MIVVDASVLASIVIDRSVDGAHLRGRLRGETVAVPDLTRIEVMSVIRRQLHSNLLDNVAAIRALDDLLDLPLIVYPTRELLARAWALRDNLTTYDACYVALAELLGCPLLTADTRLARSPGVHCPIEVL